MKIYCITGIIGLFRVKSFWWIFMSIICLVILVSPYITVKEKRLTEPIGVLHLHCRSRNIIMMSRLFHVGHSADGATENNKCYFMIHTYTFFPFTIILICELVMTATHSFFLPKAIALTSWLLREDTLPRFFSRRAAFSFAKSDIFRKSRLQFYERHTKDISLYIGKALKTY